MCSRLRNILLIFCFSKLKSWKRDVKWLHGVSGEWFEAIQKKKFKDDPDVRSLVRPPLTHHLKKTPEGGESINLGGGGLSVSNTVENEFHLFKEQ